MHLAQVLGDERLVVLPQPVEYLFVDAVYESLRRHGAKEALLVAWCIATDGRDPPGWLRNAIALTDRVVHGIDKAVQDLFDLKRPGSRAGRRASASI